MSCSELCEAFTFLMENIYMQFDGMVYQQIVGIPMGTNCAPLIADLFLYCYERDFMSDLQKSKRFDLIDRFNDTSRYLDDIFTIDNPEFEKHIPDIYPAELQLNKANTSDKETSFLDLNIKVIGSDMHTSVYDKRDDFGFPIVNFPWLSGDVPRLPSYGIDISQSVRFARCCTSVLDFHSKNFQITLKLLTQGYRYHKLRNTFGKPAGNAYPSGHLVPFPIWDLLMLQLLRPNSSNLPCLYSTFHLEYPLVLSRFCLDHILNFCRNLVIFRSKNMCQNESLTRSSTVI